MGERTSGVAGFLVSCLRYGFMLMLPALLIPLGSVEPLPLHLMATLSFALTALTFVLLAPTRESLASLAIAVALALLLAFWIVIQATDLSLGYWSNSLWGTVSKVYGAASNTMSW